MANTQTESIEVHEKAYMSLNESGICPDNSGGESLLSVGISCISSDESGIGKDLCTNNSCDNNECSKALSVGTEHNKNGVITDAEENKKCKFVCDESFSDSEQLDIGEKNNCDNNVEKEKFGNHVEIQADDMCTGMKKGDSGVDFQKSPAKDGTSDNDISESQSDSGAMSHKTDSGVALSSPFKCDDDSSRESNNVIIPQTMDTDDGGPIRSCDITMPSPNTDIDEIQEASNNDASDDNDDDDDDEMIVVRSKKARRKRRLNRLDSNSDDDDESDENAEADSETQRDNPDFDSDDDSDMNVKKSSESESEEEEFVNTNVKQTFKAIKDLRGREFGYPNSSPSSYFREKVQGSAHLVKRLKLEYKLDFHNGCVNALHFNRIGTLLASGSDDLNIVLWNWNQQRPAIYYDSGHRSNVFQAKFMPYSGDCHVVSCARDGQIRLAELSLTGICKGTKKLAQHKGAAHKLALEYDSPHVFLSCGEDAYVYGIDLRQDKPNKLTLTKEKDKKIPLYSIHSKPGNSFEFCVGGRDHFIRVYDKRKIVQDDQDSGSLKKFCPHHLVDSEVKANVTCAVYNYNGTEIIGSYNDEDIYLFNNYHTDGAEYIKRYTGHRNNHTVKGVNFYGPKSEFIVSGSDCGHVFLWDKETEEIVQYLLGDDSGAINVLEPHPTLPMLATSGLDHEVKIWSPSAEEPTDLKGIKRTMKRNMKERENERMHDVDTIDGQMLWYILHHMPRARRRAQRERDGGEGDSSSSDNSENDTSDSDDIPCAQS